MMTESFLLAAMGAIVGVFFAEWAVSMLVRTTNALPFPLPYWVQFTIDGKVLAFTLGIVLLATILSGLVPALLVGLVATGLTMSAARADSLGTSSSTVVPGPTTTMPTADRVVVYKGDRKMLLMHGDSILRTYKVSLGLNPVGHKERAGDFRTPEGRYRLTRRNPRSDFFLSIQVSYPNDGDMRKARANGWDPGGSIMIHGLPNRLKRDPDYYAERDWTDGCIAVSNSDMVEIWLLTHDNTPIDILP
jgi:murein L,D-transpeptidase YafK